MERKEITFDSFVRGALTVAGIVCVYLLLDRLSGVLLPFFLAWLIAYMLFPLVKFFQYRCKMHYRVLAVIAAILAVTLVLTGIGWLMIPPIVEESLIVTFTGRRASARPRWRALSPPRPTAACTSSTAPPPPRRISRRL